MGNEIKNLLRDVQAYIYVQSKNDALADLILKRIDRLLNEKDEES